MKPQQVTVWKPNLVTCWGSAPSAPQPVNTKSYCLSLNASAALLICGWSEEALHEQQLDNIWGS